MKAKQGHRRVRWFGLALAIATQGCGSLPSNESAIVLTIQAADPTIEAESIGLDLVDSDGNVRTETFTDIGGWPADPTEHTVLVVVSTPDDGVRNVDIEVSACDFAVLCPDPNALAAATIVLTFEGGEQLEDESVMLQ